MSNTDVLRHLLDKRCIKWTKPSKDGERWTNWHGIDGTLFSATEDARDCVWIGGSVTPIQAVTMTLGRGKCKTVVLECDEERIFKGQRVCSECGCYLGKNSMVTKNGEFDRPNFCPNCGRAVVDD